MSEPARSAAPARVRRAERHPAAGEDWFKALPHERRALMNREWRQGLARDVEIVGTERQRALRSIRRMALLYACFDLCCSGRLLATVIVAALLGGALGLLLERLNAARLLSGALGTFAFIFFEWFSRGGLSPLHFFWFFPVGAISAYLGIEREDVR